MANAHRVVIVGGGFAGLYATKMLRDPRLACTLIDKRNFHLFQPLLYQIATGALSPGDIASPLRAVFAKQKNVFVLAGEVVDIDKDRNRLILKDDVIEYDTLIIATGVSHHYFGHDEWAGLAPGLKTVEDALQMRSRIFLAFESAERQTDSEARNGWMTFIIVGGGPTGVELSGALGELAHHTLRNDFRRINPADVKILLLEATDRILPSYHAFVSAKAEKALNRLGVTVLTNCMLKDISENSVIVERARQREQIGARTVLWAAGVKASPLGKLLANRAGASLDRIGRVMVNPDLTVANNPNIFVIGDLANLSAHQTGDPLPGIAPVAMQQGRYVGRLISQRLKGRTLSPFHYRDKGSLAVIGRNAAVAQRGSLGFNGFFAWLAWVFVHIFYLIEFDNKLLVMIQWAWHYLTRKRGARLITGEATLGRGGSETRPELPQRLSQ